MRASQLTRRQVIMGGVLGMAGVTRLAGETQAASGSGARSANAGGTPAAAAGTFTIGGDLVVNRMGFGAMRVTGPDIWGEPKDPAEARRVLRRAVELGVNFIDTADSYGPEVSERLIGESLAPYPPGLVIATKGGLLRPSPPQWVPDGRPEHLRAACEGSLKRLKVTRIDLYQFHHIDPQVPLEDSLGELARLREEGKIRHVGVSNFDVEELARARQPLFPELRRAPRERAAGRDRVAAREIARHVADPRDRLGRASRGKRCGRALAAHPDRAGDARLARLS